MWHIRTHSIRVFVTLAVERISLRKLTPKQKSFLIRKSIAGNLRSRKERAKKKNRYREIVTAWLGDEHEEILCTRRPQLPPKAICPSDNPKETIKFLSEWRDLFGIRTEKIGKVKYEWVSAPRKSQKLRRINGYVDFSQIDHLSTSAALMIAAEYDRAGRLIGKVPPSINLHRWNDRVFRKLFELGFFEIVRLSGEVDEMYRDDGDVRTMKIVTGTNASDLQKTSERLVELSKFIDEKWPLGGTLLLALNTALSEGMINVSRHAYPADYHFDYAHVGSWWVTASAHRGNRRLTVVMYDQGATIPITLPKKRVTTALKDWLERNLTSHHAFDFQDDATYIEGALRHGQTQTGEPGRGQGLPQMKELIDICGSGSLTIWSRGGMCRYQPNAKLEKANFEHSIGGTLIEWIIDLPRAGGSELHSDYLNSR